MPILRIVIRRFAGPTLLALAIYAADYAAWRVRLVRGNGIGIVLVSRVSIASLKSGEEEYYFDGTNTLPCTRSLLPPPTSSGWGTPCYWLLRHRQVVTRD